MLSSVAVLLAILGFCFVIVIHELGHFLFAKWAGVKVLAFSVGFGPVIWKKQIGETEYRLSLVWAGGYVKMLGEVDETEGKEDSRSYAQAKPGWKALILLGGVTFNLISSWVLLVALALYGMPVVAPIVGELPPKLANAEAGAPMIDSPAIALGLRVGDEVRSVNGVRTRSFEDVFMQIANRGDEVITLEVKRDGETLTLTGDGNVKPVKTADRPVPNIGFVSAYTRRVAAVANVFGAQMDGDVQYGWMVDTVGDQDVRTWSGQAIEALLEQRLGKSVTVGFTRKDGTAHQVSFVYGGSGQLWPAALGLPVRVRVAPFAGSSAEKAGLLANDVIVAVDGQAVAGTNALTTAIQAKEALELTVWRNGQTITLPATPDLSPSGRASLGVAIEIASTGTLVTVPPALDGSSPLTKAGAQPGDYLFNVFTSRLQRGEQTMDVQFIRGGEVVQVAVGDRALAMPLKPLLGGEITDIREDAYVVRAADGSSVTLARAKLADQAPVFAALKVGDRVARLASTTTGYALEVVRGGQVIDALAPIPDVGLALAFSIDKVPYQLEDGLGEAVAIANHTTVRMVSDTLSMIPKFFRPKAADGIDATKALSGPIGIFVMLKDSFERWGIAAWLHLVCLIGLNLFLINLLPIPIVDGGQLAILAVETAIRRPLPDVVKNILAYAGLALVLALMLFVLSLDILRQFGLI